MTHTEGEWGWRPFATAPTNETVILVYRPDAGVFTAAYTPARTEDGEVDDDNWCWFTVEGEDLTRDLPTHWAPLPNGPEEAREDEADPWDRIAAIMDEHGVTYEGLQESLQVARGAKALPLTLTTLHQRIVALRERLGYSNDINALRAKLREEAAEVELATFPLKTHELAGEVGDMLVIAVALLHAHGLSLDDAAQAVLAKLQGRCGE